MGRNDPKTHTRMMISFLAECKAVQVIPEIYILNEDPIREEKKKNQLHYVTSFFYTVKTVTDVKC